MTEIHSPHALERWLKGKSLIWAQVIGLRLALRVLPVVATYEGKEPVQLASFRAITIAWAACRWPGRDMTAAAVEAAIFGTSTMRAARLSGPARAAAAASVSCAHICASVDTTAAIGEIREASDAAASAAIYAAVPGFWQEISHDCTLIDGQSNLPDRLLARPLWTGGMPPVIAELRRDLSALARLQHGEFWIEWYDRRNAGSLSAFGLPPQDDEAIFVNTSSEGRRFWEREAREVNVDIANWIAESRSRQPTPLPEPQNPLAPIFTNNPDGYIDLDVKAGADEVQIDAESNERHEEVCAAVERAIEACSGNAAAATRTNLERYRQSLGEILTALRPGQVIQRGEILRQELAVRHLSDSDSNLPPIPDTALLALRAVVSAHNVLVALDPALSRRDEALQGPDSASTQISRLQAQEIIDTADKAGIVTAEASEAIENAIALAPRNPVPANRLTRLLTETVRNFGRKVIATMAAHLGKILWGSATAIVAGGVAGGGLLAGAVAFGALVPVSYKIGQWAVKNETQLREMFSGHEAMLLLIDRLVEILKKAPIH